MDKIQRLTGLILDSQRPARTLGPEVAELAAILSESEANWNSKEDIPSGETRTAHGLAISPAMAAMCAGDFVRTATFIRGTHAAIRDLRKRITDRPVRILYAGCGPHATLAVPLMSVLSPTEATFTLLDLHPESIRSAKSIVDALGFADSVTSFETQDAASYRVSPDEPPDIILLEMMTACLESEPQVAITRHLLAQAPHAVLIPEEVRIDLALVDPSREFDHDGSEEKLGPIERDRIPVASVFVVNRETVASWDSSLSDRIPASTAWIPDPVEQRYQPMLFTVIRVYENHILKDYDSGLTCPRPPSIEGTFRPGETISFFYELGDRPRIRGDAGGGL